MPIYPTHTHEKKRQGKSRVFPETRPEPMTLQSLLQLPQRVAYSLHTFFNLKDNFCLSSTTFLSDSFQLALLPFRNNESFSLRNLSELAFQWPQKHQDADEIQTFENYKKVLRDGISSYTQVIYRIREVFPRFC